ncbi:uncharacterized protein LOC112083946 [Eutrema salsugineum]|uniref:uncharacterized protein LOC112083946 n=1 Tax=Eutrema salsugineum TaxID=72664 RepID=UPI000CED707E|nr:uncharacterized protein LOC112083946 [Eutrema salsugineum]
MVIVGDPDGPSRIGIPIDALVSDFVVEDSWRLPPARSDDQVLVYASISQLSPSCRTDYPVWIVAGKVKDSFSSKEVWDMIRNRKAQVAWFPLVWHKVAIPKHAFSAWLFTLNRNPTLDRLSAWGLDVENTCLLCGSSTESRNHLFFECTYSYEVWREVLAHLHLSFIPGSWNEVVLWLPTATTTKVQFLALVQGWQASMFEIWAERNRRFHDGFSLRPSQVLLKILAVLRNKSRALLQIGSKYGDGLVALWTPN